MSQDGFANILIVDDDPVVADSLATFLRSEGHRVQIAPDADDALEKLDRAGTCLDDADPFDLAICDVALPGRDGLELLRRANRLRLLRRCAGWPHRKPRPESES